MDTYHIDTSNILFIFSGAFVGLDQIVKRRVAKGVGVGMKRFWVPTKTLIVYRLYREHIIRKR